MSGYLAAYNTQEEFVNLVNLIEDSRMLNSVCNTKSKNLNKSELRWSFIITERDCLKNV